MNSIYIFKLYIFLNSIFIGLDAPVVTVTNASPKEAEEITFTCTEKTSDTGAVYKWYNNDGVIASQSAKTYKLTGGVRANDGEYHCSVTTAMFSTAKISNKQAIKYLCELFSKFFFHFYLLAVPIIY